MASLSPTQQAWRARIEAALRLAAPALDLLLAAGDRVSRLAAPGEEWTPPQPVTPARRPPRVTAGPRS